MRWPVLVVLLGLAACSPAQTASAPTPLAGGQLPSASAGPTPTPSIPASGPTVPVSPLPKPTSLAVLVDLFAGPDAYDIALVSADAAVVARAHPHLRSAIADATELPYVSASDSRVYYLDGDQQISWLKADGTTGQAQTVPGGAQVHATFAVTPDDSRIAVALLDYSVNPVNLTLYVEDLGGAHRAVIFTSNSKYVWPVAWHAGQLVVAYLGPGAAPFKSKTLNYSNRDLNSFPYGPNPYGGINFHVIDPATAQREAIISGGGASGLLTRAGSAIVQGTAVDWQGQYLLWNSPHDYGSFSAAGSLSPDGHVIAACCPQPAAQGQLVLWYPGDQTRILGVTTTSIDWVGWLDNSHLVTGYYQTSDGTPSVVDINSSSVKPVNAHGIVAAMLPGGLD